MKPVTSTSDGQVTPAVPQQPDAQPLNTPNADMQAQDSGSDASAAAAESDSSVDSATAATRAMKQTSKTAPESGGKR